MSNFALHPAMQKGCRSVNILGHRIKTSQNMCLSGISGRILASAFSKNSFQNSLTMSSMGPFPSTRHSIGLCAGQVHSDRSSSSPCRSITPGARGCVFTNQFSGQREVNPCLKHSSIFTEYVHTYIA